jgi:hypothetical protein
MHMNTQLHDEQLESSEPSSSDYRIPFLVTPDEYPG